MLLGQANAQQVFDDGAKPDTGQVGHARGDLGVKKAVRVHAQLRQAGQVLCGSMEDPLGLTQGSLQGQERVEGFGVDQPDARTGSLELNKERALSVAESGSSLRVDGHGARAGSKCVSAAGQAAFSVDDGGNAAVGLSEQGKVLLCVCLRHVQLLRM
ncbi:hypothetical protein GCM10009771_10300 [Nesterenkonia flava]